MGLCAGEQPTKLRAGALKLGRSMPWLGLALKRRCLRALCSMPRCATFYPAAAQVHVLGTMPAGRLCCYCGVMGRVSSINQVTTSILALRSRVSHNLSMKRTRVAPVQGPQCARASLAHCGPGKQRPRAVYLGRYNSGF